MPQNPVSICRNLWILQLKNSRSAGGTQTQHLTVKKGYKDVVKRLQNIKVEIKKKFIGFFVILRNN